MHGDGPAIAQRVERVSIGAAAGLRDVSITFCANEFPGRITTEMRSHEMCPSILKDERRVVVGSAQAEPDRPNGIAIVVARIILRNII
jgi:hypothetical protein